MRRLFLRFLLITPMLALITFGPGALSPALGAPPCVCGVPGPACGDGVGPCHCGSTVVTNTRLNGSDPVLKAPCPCDGLFVASGVTLEIGGTIRSQRNLCSGIVASPFIPLPPPVTVKIGRIVGFAIGVEGDGVAGSQFSRLQIADSDFGMALRGDQNVIENNVITRSALAGIAVDGTRNVVRLNQTKEGDRGIVVGGSGNVVSRNLALRHELHGFVISGDGVTVDRNQAKYNGAEGFFIDGVNHTVTLNIAEQNALDGFTVFAGPSTFARNRSNYNGAFGIRDLIPNTYTDNRCTGNTLGDSEPPGLCF